MTSRKWQKAAHCCGSVRVATYSVPATMSLEFQVGPCCSKPHWEWITHPTVSRLVLSTRGVRSSASLFSALQAGTRPEQEMGSPRAENSTSTEVGKTPQCCSGPRLLQLSWFPLCILVDEVVDRAAQACEGSIYFIQPGTFHFTQD